MSNHGCPIDGRWRYLWEQFRRLHLALQFEKVRFRKDKIFFALPEDGTAGLNLAVAKNMI